MKTLNSVFGVLVLSVVVLLFASARESAAGQSEYYSNGILRMKHSPVLGLNIPINVWIDGVQQGSFTKGHVFERALSPGRHTIYASRPSRRSDSFFGTVEVRPGETLSFVVSCTVGQVILSPVGQIN